MLHDSSSAGGFTAILQDSPGFFEKDARFHRRHRKRFVQTRQTRDTLISDMLISGMLIRWAAGSGSGRRQVGVARGADVDTIGGQSVSFH